MHSVHLIAIKEQSNGSRLVLVLEQGGRCIMRLQTRQFEVSFNFGNLAPDCLFYCLRSKVAALIVIAAKLELRPQIDTNCSDSEIFEQL